MVCSSLCLFTWTAFKMAPALPSASNPPPRHSRSIAASVLWSALVFSHSNAVVASADYLAKNAKRPKQVLLIVTDGEDNASSATLEQAIRRIQDLDGPVIYSIGLLFGDTSKSEARHARRVLDAE